MLGEYPTDQKEYRVVRVERGFSKEELGGYQPTDTLFFVEYLEKSWYGKKKWSRPFSGQKSLDDALGMIRTMIRNSKRVNGNVISETVVWGGEANEHRS